MDIWRRHVNGDIDDAVAAPRTDPHLSIGLALGGGAARGFAHIGVLRTLNAHGIWPDVIAGTSIGAVVGGYYAAGRLDIFEHWARQLTRRRLLGYLDFKFGGSGLIGGGRLANRLDDTLGDTTFADLPLRLATIATEIGTGHEIWLTRGRLGDAMAASYALPGIFPPQRIGGRWLMDGALVNPLPISAARALGARLVIAVNLNADNFGRGTIIQDHGPDAEDDAIRAERVLVRNRRGLFRAERLIHRQFFGVARQPGLVHRDGRGVPGHAGPHHALAPRRRSARRDDQPAGRADQPVRVSPRPRHHRARRRGGGEVDRRDPGVDRRADVRSLRPRLQPFADLILRSAEGRVSKDGRTR